MKFHALVALFLSAALLLTGCSEEEPQPKIAEEPSATPTVVEEETAEEFIRRWNDEQREMQKGDTSEYRRIAKECEPCMSAADQIDNIYAAGGYVKTEGRTIKSISRAEKTNGMQTFRVKMVSAPTEYQEQVGAGVQTLEGGPVTYNVSVFEDDDGEWSFGFYIKVLT